MKILFGIFFLYFICGNADSQQLLRPKTIPLQMPATIINGDTVALCQLPVVNVISFRVFANTQEALNYYRLCYNVKIAYPYAILAETTYKECEQKLSTMTSNSEKRKYLKQVENQMDEEYKKDLKNMTEEQGRILIKLIDRETGSTSYEMVKELKGSLTAFMWQTVAGLFHNNLKDTYNPDSGEDKDIENIINLIEMGEI